MIFLFASILSSCNPNQNTPQETKSEVIEISPNSLNAPNYIEFKIDSKIVSPYEYINSLPENGFLDAVEKDVLSYLDSILTEKERNSLSSAKQISISNAESYKSISRKSAMSFYDGNHNEISAIDFLTLQFSKPDNGALSAIPKESISKITNLLSENDKLKLTPSQLEFLISK